MLSNWKGVWVKHTLARNFLPFGIFIPDEEPVSEEGVLWKRDGFMKHAPELWLLSKKLLQCITSAPKSSSQDMLLGFPSTHDDLQYSSLPTKELQAYEEFDDTSMNQLSHLLNSFAALKV
jgi:hypothetical protein